MPLRTGACNGVHDSSVLMYLASAVDFSLIECASETVVEVGSGTNLSDVAVGLRILCPSIFAHRSLLYLAFA